MYRCGRGQLVYALSPAHAQDNHVSDAEGSSVSLGRWASSAGLGQVPTMLCRSFRPLSPELLWAARCLAASAAISPASRVKRPVGRADVLCFRTLPSTFRTAVLYDLAPSPFR